MPNGGGDLGRLGVFAGTRAAALGAAVIIIGICLSRLYLGVHDIEDVVRSHPGGPQPTALRALPGGAHQAVEKPLLASSGGPAPRSSGFAPAGMARAGRPRGRSWAERLPLRMVARAPARARGRRSAPGPSRGKGMAACGGCPGHTLPRPQPNQHRARGPGPRRRAFGPARDYRDGRLRYGPGWRGKVASKALSPRTSPSGPRSKRAKVP